MTLMNHVNHVVTDDRTSCAHKFWVAGRAALSRAFVAVFIVMLAVSSLGAADLHIGDILVVDGNTAGGRGGVMLIDPVTGAQSFVSSGDQFRDPVSLAIDSDGTIVVCDRQLRTIFRVDPVTGAQTVITSGGFVDPFGIALDASGNIYVADTGWNQTTGVNVAGSIIRVNPITGTQTTIATGGFLADPWTVAVEAGGTLVVSDSTASVAPFTGQGGVIRIDPVTGAQSALSVFTLGPAGTPGCAFGITVEASGSILTTVFSYPDPPAPLVYGCVPPAVFRVDPVTGATTTLSAYPAVAWRLPFGIDVDLDGSILVSDETARAVYRLNPTTGARTLISSGGNFVNPVDVAVVKAVPSGGNQAPVITTINAAPSTVNEGGSITVTGSFTDANANDAHTVTVNWGDGVSSSVPLAGGVLNFSANHVYADDRPSGTPSDPYTISVTVADSTLNDVMTTGITVNNAAPAITGVSAPSGNQVLGASVTIGANFADAGVQDTHTCTITWGDGANAVGSVTSSNGSGSCSGGHIYTTAGTFNVTVTVTDDDGGVADASVDVTIEAGPPDTTPPTAPSSLVAAVVSATGINLSWGASTDNLGVAGYVVERCAGTGCSNFAAISTLASTSFSDTGLTANTPYSYRIVALDGFANQSGYSNVASAATTAATALASLAASMAPGTWAELSTININPTLALTGGASGTTLAYSDDAVWDPITHQWLFLGGDHDPASGCPRFVSYTEGTNTWQILPGASWFWCGNSRMHGFNHNAIDQVNGKFYHRKFGDMVVRKYDIATQVWTDLPAIPSSVVGYNQCCTAIQWFPERNSLVYASIETGTNGAVAEYRESTGQWVRLGGGLPMGQYQGFMKYNPVHQVVLFGGGEGDRHMYKLDAAGVVTALNDAPIPMGILEAVVTVDPVSGKYLIFGNANDFYTYDVTTDTWALQAGQEPPIFDDPYYNPPIYGIVVAPVNTYGVNFFAKCNPSTCHAYLYKHLDTVDTTAPSISAVAVSGITTTAATITWTTSEAADTQVMYGTTAAYGQTTSLNSLRTLSHSVTLSGLTPSTQYHFAVRSADGSGNVGLSTDATFTTATPDTTAPAISGIAVSNITPTSVTIAWTTNEAADTQVVYGTTAAYGSSTTLNSTLATAHSVNITGLTAGTTYHYSVRSKDASANLGSSPDDTFTTAPPDTTAPTAPSVLSATAVSFSQIGLTWTASTDNVGVTGYQIERCQGAGCSSFALVGTSTAASYNDAGLAASTPYSYRVRATDGSGNFSGYSNTSSATTQAMPASTGLVAAYSFDEGAGTTVADASGNGNSGTLINATWNNGGKFGQTLAFNGAARVRINDSASLHLTTGMTLEAWVYPTGALSGWQDIIYKQDDRFFLEASSTFGLGPTGGGSFGNGLQTVSAPTPLPLNAWTHVAVTFDGAKIVMWMNGVSVAARAQTFPLTISTLPLEIGGDSLYGQGFTGRIDNVRVYNRALSQAELEVDMNTPVAAVSDAVAPTAPAATRAFTGGPPATVISRQVFTSGNSASSHTTVSFDSSGGDLIVVFGSSHENVATMTLTDSKGNTWIPATGAVSHPSGSVDLRSQLWYATAPNAGLGHTVTLSLSSPNFAVISVLVIKGSRISSPLDVTSAIADDGGVLSSSIISPSITTTQPGDLLLEFAKTVLPVSWTVGNGFTYESTASSQYVATESRLAGLPGSYSASLSLSPATNWQNVLTSVVSANASGQNSITVAWDASTDTNGVTGYSVERCFGSGCSDFSVIGATNGYSQLFFTDNGLSSGTTYTYRVRAMDAAGNFGPYSPMANATTTGAADTVAPSAPTNLSATASGAAQINLSWTAATDNVGVTGYRIERCQGAGCTSFAQIGTATATSFSDTGLSENTAYRYRVRASDAAVNLSDYSNIASATTAAGPPSAPGNLTATAAGGTQVDLTWTASTSSIGIQNYSVERCTGAGCSSFAVVGTVPSTSFSDTGLASGVSYSYRVRAADLNNTTGAYSNTATAVTADTVAPTAPSTLAAVASGTQVNLTWTASTDNLAVTSYLIERCQGAGCSDFAQIATSATASYANSGLAEGTSYSYRVRATDAAGNLSGYSNVASATTTTTPPTAPTSLTATAAGTQINLSWGASTSSVGILNYSIERCQGAGCSTFAALATSATTSYSDTGASVGVSYSYRVRATDVNNTSGGYSNTASASIADTVAPSVPGTLSATTFSSTQINLSWGASTDNVAVTGYRLERCQGAGCGTFIQIGTLTTTTYSDTGLTASTSYSYRVRAMDAAGNLSGYSNVGTAVTSTAPPVTGLVLAYGFNEGTGTTTADASANSYTGTLANGATWTAGNSGNALSLDGTDDRVSVTNTLDVPTLPLTLEAWVRPTSFAQWRAIFSKRASYTSSGIRFDVGLQSGNGRVYMATYTSLLIFTYAPPLNTWTHLAVVADSTSTRLYANGVLQQALSPAILGTSATAPVSIGRAGDGDDPFAGAIDDLRLYSRALAATEIVTDMNTPVTGTPAPTAPGSLTATLFGTNRIDLAWTASTSAAGILNYGIERCAGVGCSSFTALTTTTTTSYSDSAVTAGVSYSYRVRATDINNVSGSYSNTATAATPDTVAPTAPSSLAATAIGATQINLSWTAATDNIAVTGYQVERCAGAGCSDFTQIATTTAPAYGDASGLAAGNTYNYRVRATDAAANLGGYSNVATATTPAPDLTAPTDPSGLAATAISSSQINLSWTGSTDNVGVTGYRIERCQGAGCTTFAQIATTATTSYSDTGLAAATAYSYRVRANDAAGNLSGYSNTASATTPTAPASTGLVLAYGFNEGTGTTTADASPNGYTGTLTGGAAWMTGNSGNAVSFDGSDDRVALSNTLDIAALPLTLEAWVRPTTFVQWRAIFSKRSTYNASGMRFDIGLRSGNGRVYMTTYNSLLIFNYSPPQNTWTHLAVVADSTGTRLYANGVLQQTMGVATLGSGATATVSIGRAGDGDDPFAGGIDDLRLYNRSLSAGEILTDMNTPVAGTPAPTAPGSLSATASGSQIDLTWTASTSAAGILNYGIERCAGAGCSSFAPLANATATSYSDTSVAAGVSYSYRVRATDVNNIPGGYSNTATAATADTVAPSAPSTLAASAFSATQINLTWTAATDNIAVTGYQVERCAGAGCSNFASIATPAAAAYSDTGLAAGISYSYRVRATDAAGNLGGYSNVATASTPAPDLTAPTDPSGLAATAISSTQINLSWTASTDNVAVTGYRLERCQGAGCSTFAQIATPATTSYSDTGLTASTSYSYRVRANDAAGNLSGYSNVASATTQSAPVNTGLIAAFGFNENTGTATADRSGNSYNGTLVNGATWTAGNNGSAVSLDGTNDGVTLPSTLDTPALPLTIEAWIRPTSFAQWRAIFSKRASYTGAGMRLDAGLWNQNGRVYITSSTTLLTFSYTPPLNTWTHIAITLDSTGSRLYVNGVLNQTLGVLTLGTGASAPVGIGRTGDGNDPFAGGIDDFRLYSRSLTLAEIQADMTTPVLP